MNILRFFPVILVILASTLTGQVRFAASTQRTKVAMGEQILVTAQLVTSKSPDGISAPQIAPSDGFTLLKTDQRQSSSSSIQIVNGQASQKTEYIFNFLYVITPKTTGTFTFPALDISVAGTDFKTEPITFNVSNEVVKNSDIKVILSLAKRSLFVGEQSILTFKIAQRAESSIDISKSFMPAISKIEEAFGKSFSLVRMFTNQVTSGSEMIDGEAYKLYSLQFIVVPLNAGQISIGGIPVDYLELQRSKRRRVDPFFDDFFNSDFFGGGVEATARSAVSNTLSIDVKTLPAPAPEGFSGSVGKFTLTAEVSPLEVPSGESVTLKINIKGSTRPGSIGELALPDMQDCEVFKPERQVSADTTSSGISTRQTYKYLIIPRQEGTLTIPSVKYPYFDPESGAYKTASSDPISITVTRGKEGSQQQTRYLTQEEIRQVGSDIRYIKTDVKVNNQSRYPHRNPMFIVLVPLPLIMLILSVLFRIQASRKDITIALNIRKNALGLAFRKLGEIKKRGTSLSAVDFCSKIAEIIEQFISQKCGFAATGRTLDELKIELEKYTSNKDTISELTTFMSMLDGYRFGGLAFDDKSRTTIIAKTENFLSKIEHDAKKEKKSPLKNSIIASLLLFILVQMTSAAPVNLWFEKANTYYANQQFDSAVIYYEKVIESGTQSGAVYYNLGNSWYRLKKAGLARLYFEKALLLDPLDNDIQSNIRFISSSIVDRVPEPEKGFFEMIFMQLHHQFSLSNQLWIFIAFLFLISFSIIGILFLTGNIRLWLIYLTVLFSLLTAGTGLSIGIKIYDSEKITHAVLLSATSDAKNEPDGAKILFTAHEGTKFRIRKESGKWSLVSLPNGVSGWVKNSDLGKI